MKPSEKSMKNATKILEAFDKILDKCVHHAKMEERERCINIALGEKVDAESTGEETDRAYNLACNHIADAIRKEDSA